MVTRVFGPLAGVSGHRASPAAASAAARRPATDLSFRALAPAPAQRRALPATLPLAVANAHWVASPPNADAALDSDDDTPASLPANRACADAVLMSSLLQPESDCTAELVKSSALARLDDLHAIGEVLAMDGAYDRYLASWQECMQRLSALSVGERVRRGASPLFRRWVHSLGRALIDGADAARVSMLLGYAPNYCLGFGGSDGLSLRARGRMIETWDCASSLQLPPDAESLDWRVKDMRDERVVVAPDTRGSAQGAAVGLRVQSGVPLLRDVSNFGSIVIRNDLPSLRVCLDETRTAEREDAILHDWVDPRDQAYPAGQREALIEAAQWMSDAWPEMVQEWRAILSVVVPRMPPRGWQMNGFTLSSMQGAVWVHPGRPLQALEGLLHEAAHVKLRYVEEFCPMLAAAQTAERFQVSWRTDARPVAGVFEGTYVSAMAAEGLHRAVEAGAVPLLSRLWAQRRVADLRRGVRQATAVLRKHARFTPEGANFCAWIESRMEALS